MFKYNNNSIEIDNNFAIIKKDNNSWIEDKEQGHKIIFYTQEQGHIELPFEAAKEIISNEINDSLFIGIKTTYSNFPNFEDFSFSTSILIDKQNNSFLFILEPNNENTGYLRSISWPAPFKFDEKRKSCYAVVNMCQGALLVNGSDDEIIPRKRWDLESGYNFTRTNYMPWYSLVRDEDTLYAQYLEPFDTGFDYEKLKKGCAKVSHIVHSQLGKINYCRRLRIKLLQNADYNTVSKEYRKYLIDSGKFISLREKINKNENLKKLIGSSLIHTDIYHKYSPDCFDVIHKNILEKEKVVTFDQRKNQILKLKQLGIDKAYVHIDGWNNEGYDNQHPDTFPPTEKAGGLKKMIELINTIHECSFLAGIHDQYRDIYLDAPSYNSDYTIEKYDGEKYSCTLWEGGAHEALNPMFSKSFVERNYNLYKNNELNLDGTYLDVFSVISLDESYSKNYPLTRENCAKYRADCFQEIRKRKLLIQSEEGSSWAIPHLDFTHHLPYWMITSEDQHQMIGKIEDKAIGVPVPLSTLVFHDCIITPWTNETKNWKSCSNAALMAIIHGGIPYLNIDETNIIDTKKAMKFHELICFEELLKHEYLDKDYTVHHSVFSSGYECYVDTNDDKFKIFKDGNLIFNN